MNAFNDFTFRFLETIEGMNLTDYKVWNTLENLSKATMSKIRRGVCGVSMNTLQEFLLTYPDVNADYIITGRGSMFISHQIESDNSKNEMYDAVVTNAKERFYLVMKELGINDYQLFTKIDGITKNMAYKLRSGLTEEVSTKILTPFLQAYPKVNANYILTGHGRMFIE